MRVLEISEEKMQMKKGLILYNVVMFEICLMTGMVVTTSILLLLGISVGWINFLIPLFLCAWYFYNRTENCAEWIKLCIISVVVFGIFVFFAGSIFDRTWDGAAYHKQAIGLLKEGWNPVYFSSDEYNVMIGSIQEGGTNPLYWAEAYPKSTWYFAAVIYFLTGNIETGKAYSLLFMFITFGLVYDWLIEFELKKYYRVILSFLIALNPISLAQFDSYYIDGVATCVLILLILYLPTLLVLISVIGLSKSSFK